MINIFIIMLYIFNFLDINLLSVIYIKEFNKTFKIKNHLKIYF